MTLAYPLAYFLVFKVKSDRLRMVLYMAVIVPLWVSYLLRSYTWNIILGSEGVLNSFLVWVGKLDKPTDIFLYNLWLPNIQSGRIPRDSERRDMITIDDRDHQNTVVGSRRATQIA